MPAFIAAAPTETFSKTATASSVHFSISGSSTKMAVIKSEKPTANKTALIKMFLRKENPPFLHILFIVP